MDAAARRWFRQAIAAGILHLLLRLPAPAQAPAAHPAKLPSLETVVGLLQREPMTPKSWPAWRARLWDWLDDRSDNTTPAFTAAWDFVKQQAGTTGELPPEMAKDAFAWYLLGSAYLADASQAKGDTTGFARAERALRRSLQLDPKFARAHARLAQTITHTPTGGQVDRARLDEASRELATARQLNANLPFLAAHEGELALRREQPRVAQQFFEQALREEPNESSLAGGLAWAIILDRDTRELRAPRVKELVDRFPNDGRLLCLYAVTLAQDGHPVAAARRLRQARELGADPAQVLRPDVVEQIDRDAGPWLFLTNLGLVLLGIVVFYAVTMVLMAGAGVLLARRTRGTRALDLLGDDSLEWVAGGQVLRAHGESFLARLYALALVVGLVLFYVAIPFVVAGLVAATGLLLYGIFLLPRIPIKLIVIVVVVGLGMAWAVFKSLFARPARVGFGLAKSAADCPRLYEALAEVAGRVDTEPVHDVYLAPGSSIGVHQEGRGPFGLFGVKRRVLTLGLSTMHFLTIAELKAILAHEYAHFSHRDTFYSRFIYQVSLSIGEALRGMGLSGGQLNYVNPFFWFLYLYHKAYSLLSAGFSRSREFLADRMAASLYGSDVFTRALTKVCTDGTLFEMTIYGNIAQLLEENKAFVNMYTAFRSFRDEQLTNTEREELYHKLLEEKESLFASHPTFRERQEAVAALPSATAADATPALALFDAPEEIEKELTEFLTAYLHHVRQLQAQAAAQ
jgi:Zn-dependent protease with chaperone function